MINTQGRFAAPGAELCGVRLEAVDVLLHVFAERITKPDDLVDQRFAREGGNQKHQTIQKSPAQHWVCRCGVTTSIFD